MRNTRIWGALGAPVVALAVVLGARGEVPAPPAPSGTRGSVPRHQEPVAPAPAVPAAAPGTTPESADDLPRARFPGGPALPLLNGVAEPVEMPWPGDRPFAPVAEVVREHGQDWYRHADGSWSTTQIDPQDPRRSIGLVFTPERAGSPALRGPRPAAR